jgi:predicted ATPase
VRLRRRARSPERRRRRASFDTPLVGRDPELEVFRRVLRDVWRQRGAVLTVVGEAGVGKTRLIDELAVLARRRDGLALAGRAFETAQVLPFGPWVDALRSDPAVLAQAGALAPAWRLELARLLPELGPQEPDASADALRLFQAVSQLVGRLAPARPLVVVLEDLHWADEMSLRLLAFVGRQVERSAVLVVATAREEEIADVPLLVRTLEELSQHPWSVSRSLLPLSRRDTGVLVRSLGGAYRDASTLERVEERVWQVSEGNPFLVVETMRSLGDNVEPADPLALPLPRRIRELVTARLGQLSDESRHLVEIASVIGREFDFALLQRAAGLDDRDTARAVEALVRRRVLHGVGEHLDFTHDHIREVARHRST